MHTRRQKLILSILLESHNVGIHPSPAHISSILERRTEHKLGGVKTIRAELIRLMMDGTIREVETRGGSAANRYRLSACTCPYCLS